MSKLKHLTPLVLALLVAAIVSAMAGRPHNKVTSPQEKQATDDEFQKQFPLVDYIAPDALSREARAERQRKSAKYDNANLALDPNITEDGQITSFLDWEGGASALPVDKSAAIIVGQVTNAQAYLSNNKTAVYSEFTIQIDSVLKNDRHMPLKSGSSVAAEREGGRVRYPTGKIELSLTVVQGMPLPGHSYVLFLTHDFNFHGTHDDAFHLLTAYELRNGKVFPLDNPGNGTHPMAAYTGTDEKAFMNDLRAALRKAAEK